MQSYEVRNLGHDRRDRPESNEGPRSLLADSFEMTGEKMFDVASGWGIGLGENETLSITKIPHLNAGDFAYRSPVVRR